MIAALVTSIKRGVTLTRGFLIGNHKTIAVLTMVLLIALIPFSAEANVNLNCGGGRWGDVMPDWGCVAGELLLKLASVFAWITGNILDLVVKFFVFEMSATLEEGTIFTANENDLPVYRQIWFIVRDLANLSFIFILIYISLNTIFKTGKTNYKRAIPILVLVAILMNFSLFFVQVAVDVSNYVAYQFFTNVELNIVDDSGATVINEHTGQPMRGKLASSDQQGLSNIIMNVTRVTALVGTPADAEASQGISVGNDVPAQPGFAFGFFAAIFVFIAGLVMLAGAILLFFRFFMLLIYMMSSPLAFAAYAVGAGKKNSLFKKWQGGLTSQLIFAPAFFGLMYLSLRFLSSMNIAGITGGETASDALAYWVANAMGFLIAGAFLIGSLIAAKSLGVTGAGAVNRFTKRLGGAVALGGAAMVGRNTVGRLANRYVNSNQDRLRQRMAQGGVRGKIAKMQLQSGRKLQKSSFDARLGIDRIPGVKMAEISFGNRGDIKKKSYEQKLEVKAKNKTDEAKDVAKSLNEEQRNRYANRLKTQKDGLRGLFQFATHQESENGELVLREWSQKYNDWYTSRLEEPWLAEEALMDTENPGLMRRKSSAVLNRFRNLMLRNELLLGEGTDDKSAIRQQEQEIAEQRHSAEYEIKENNTQKKQNKQAIAEQREIIFVTKDEQSRYSKELDRLNEEHQQAIDAGDAELRDAIDIKINEMEKALEYARTSQKLAEDRIIALKELNRQIEVKNASIRAESDRLVQSWRDGYSLSRSTSRLGGGFAETKAGAAIAKYKETIEKDEEKEKMKDLFEIIKKATAVGSYEAEEQERAMDASN